ncbi:MAG: PHP domain-containing protein [Peptococcaceae bacterium]|nr:PHP domain-containing protein [Peptococcaceae bacterium]
MKFSGDYHMHSKYSDGRATVREMVQAGRREGLQAMAITDHGPHNVGFGIKNSAAFLDLKQELARMNDEYLDINLLVGCEADIVGMDGEIDVPEDIYRQLDLLIVGLHPLARPNNLVDLWPLNIRNQLARYSHSQRQKVIAGNTKTLIAAMEKHPVNIISHPGLGMPIEVAEVARACVRNNVFFEINTGHHFPSLEDVRTAYREGVDFIVDSDAHFVASVGQLDYGARVLERAGVPVERIANACGEGKTLPWEK